MPNWKKVITSGSNAELAQIKLTDLSNQGSETTTLVINNSGVVGTRENAASSTETEYKLVDNILGITSTSNIYLLQETSDEKYELLFGDGVFGNKLDAGKFFLLQYNLHNIYPSNVL